MYRREPAAGKVRMRYRATLADRSWLSPVCYVLALVVAALACTVPTDVADDLAFTVAGLLPMVAIPVGCRRYRVPDRRPWTVAMVGLGLITVANVESTYRAFVGRSQWYAS